MQPERKHQKTATAISAESAAETTAPCEKPTRELERSEAAELVETLVDLLAGKCAKTFNSELLTAEASHNRSVNYRAMELMEIGMMVAQIEFALRVDDAKAELVVGWCVYSGH